MRRHRSRSSPSAAVRPGLWPPSSPCSCPRGWSRGCWRSPSTWAAYSSSGGSSRMEPMPLPWLWRRPAPQILLRAPTPLWRVATWSRWPAKTRRRDCSSFSDGLAQLNPRPDVSAPNGVCGSGTALPTCKSATTGAPIGNLKDCPPLPSWVTDKSLPYVETYTLTKSTQANNTILPKFFSQALAGGSGPNTSVSACARATWGPAAPSSSTVIALTMSECDWRSQTGYTGPGTGTYPPAPIGTPGYDNDPAQPLLPMADGLRTGRLLQRKRHHVHDLGSRWHGARAASPGWTPSPPSNCLGTVVNNGWIHGDTGNDGCEQVNSRPTSVTVVYIPVFDCMMKTSGPILDPPGCNSGSGNGTYYHISGYAGFYLSGWAAHQGKQSEHRHWQNGLWRLRRRWRSKVPIRVVRSGPRARGGHCPRNSRRSQLWAHRRQAGWLIKEGFELDEPTYSCHSRCRRPGGRRSRARHHVREERRPTSDRCSAPTAGLGHASRSFPQARRSKMPNAPTSSRRPRWRRLPCPPGR